MPPRSIPPCESMKPEISVVVPVYNVEAYLVECLDSILAQTYADIEVICVDDCSKDRSSGILEAYAAKDTRIRVVRHERNAGLSSARNTGIDVSRGKWMIFVDSDDIVSRTLCERTLNAALKFDADVVFYGYIAFRDGQTPSLNNHCTEPVPANREGLLSRKAFAWTKFIRRELMIRKNIRFPIGLCFEDVPVHWRLSIESTKPVVLDEAHVGYRQRKGSITYRKDWTRADSLKIYDIVAQQLQESGNWDVYADRFRVDEMENFAATYAYFELANRDLLPQVAAEASQRMTDAHRKLAINAIKICGWQRSMALSLFSSPGQIGQLLWIAHRILIGARSLVRRALHSIYRT
jgi:glycosyltransferase involved in cell wall biosynthesis